MRVSQLLIPCGVTALLAIGLVGRASADANHQILSQGPMKERGKVVGWKATLLADPQKVTVNHPTLGGDLRIGLGRMKYVDRGLGPSSSDNRHRQAIAGLQPGYLLHQLEMREITGPNATDRGAPTHTFKTDGQPRELEVQVRYKDNPTLIPGSKVDLVAGFLKSSWWHIWGAAHGPIHSSQDYVIELPGKANTRSYQRAIKHLSAQQAKLDAAAKKADKELAAAEAALTAAQALHYSTPNRYATVEAAEEKVAALKRPGAEAKLNAERIDELKQQLDAFIAAKAAAKQAGAAQTAQAPQTPPAQ